MRMTLNDFLSTVQGNESDIDAIIYVDKPIFKNEE